MSSSRPLPKRRKGHKNTTLLPAAPARKERGILCFLPGYSTISPYSRLRRSSTAGSRSAVPS